MPPLGPEGGDWPVRLGLLVPSANTVLERDAQTRLPGGVTAHVARLKITRDDPEQLAALRDQAPAAAGLLADAGVHAVAFGCTTGSLFGGLGYDHQIVDRIEAATAIPATTAATALVDALTGLGVASVALVSPYEPWLAGKVVDFLRASGIAVDGVRGFGLPDPRDIAAVPPAAIAEAVRVVDSDRVDAVVVSCTALRGLEAVGLVGDGLGKPVVSTNQAILWKLARMVDRPAAFAAAPDRHVFQLVEGSRWGP